MKNTRLSLFYLASYLFFGGAMFLICPRLSLSLFFSTGNYADVMLRLVGVLMLGLGILVVQLIRHRVEPLYGTTLIVRSVILTALLVFYLTSKDPMMLLLFGIVGFGFILTLVSYVKDRRASAS